MRAAICRILLMLATGIPGIACSCANYERVLACEVFQQTQVVFRGRVVNDNADSRLGFVQWTLYRFHVEEAFKGLTATVREVFIDPGSFTSCYGGFSKDRDYLIYAGGSQPAQTFSSYFARVKDAKSRDGSVKPLPPAWKDLRDIPVFSSPECSPSRVVEGNDSDLEYLRSATQGKLSSTGFLQGRAAQNAGWPYSFRDFLPVADASVTATGRDRSWSDTTKADGSYLIDSLPPGSYTLTFTSARFGIGKSVMNNPTIEVPAGGCAVVRASFATNASIDGKVQDASGKPAKGIRIEAGELVDRGQVRVIPNTWTNSGADGTFTVKNVPIGRIVVGANVNGAPDVSMPFDATYVPGTSDLALARVFTLQPSQQVGGVVLTLPDPLPFARMFVDVLWPDGSPATGGARGFANWRGRRSAFERAPNDSNRVTLNLALGRTYDISVDWLSDRGGQFVVIEGGASQPVAFTHDGQIASLLLKEKRAR